MGISSAVLFAHNVSGFDGYFLSAGFARAKIPVKVARRAGLIYYLKARFHGINLEFKCSLLFLKEDLNACAASFNISITN